jgi:hypothetical protein
VVVPRAIWNPVRDVWETESIDLLSEHSDVFLETWPTSGMTRNGSVYELLMPALPTVDSASSYLPTPKASDGMMGTPSTSGRPVERSTFLSTQAMLLAGHLEHRRLMKTPTSQLADEVEHLLPTPVVTDSAGTRNSTAVRSDLNSKHHAGSTLTDVLLPTPLTTTARGVQELEHRVGGRMRPLLNGGSELSEEMLQPPLWATGALADNA